MTSTARTPTPSPTHPSSPLPNVLLGLWIFLATQWVALAALAGVVLVLRVGQGLPTAFIIAPHWGVAFAPAVTLLLVGGAVVLGWDGAPWRVRRIIAVTLTLAALMAAAPVLTLFGEVVPMEPDLTTFCRRAMIVFFLLHAALYILLLLRAAVRSAPPATTALAWYGAFTAVVWPVVALAAYL